MIRSHAIDRARSSCDEGNSPGQQQLEAARKRFAHEMPGRLPGPVETRIGLRG